MFEASSNPSFVDEKLITSKRSFTRDVNQKGERGFLSQSNFFCIFGESLSFFSDKGRLFLG